MDEHIFSALREWARLESLYNIAKSNCETGAELTAYAALVAKSDAILAMRARTKSGAFAQLRFCATFLEMRCEQGRVAAEAIRNTANFLFLESAPAGSP
jgi:hypothetical protein